MNNFQYLLIYLVFTLLVLFTSHFPFFWDTIQLASKHAHFFYETNFRSIILPNEMDSGHLPGLGMYLAVIWKIFGKSLLVSHLAMLPFVWGIVYQSIKLTQKLFPAKWAFAALVILLADATLMAQCTLVSPDVWVMFFFLMALNGILFEKRILYTLALVGLVFSSMRGMMCVAGLFVADGLINVRVKGLKKFLRTLFPFVLNYLPAVLITVAFLSWHYYKTGWIGYHKGMPWYPLFETASPAGMVWNTGIVFWRLIDMGRLFIWIMGAVCFWHYLKNRPELDRNIKKLFTILFFVFVALAQAIILHKGLAQHRYLLPVFMLVALCIMYYTFHYLQSVRLRKWLTGIVLVGMVSGNFWIYPDRIAKGWDSTLAYIPYFPLRQEMMQYLKENRIPLQEVGSPFPNHGPLEYIDLSGSYDSFAEPNLKKNKYVFYSNVFNSFTDDELLELNQHWKVVKEFHCLQVRVVLYKKDL